MALALFPSCASLLPRLQMQRWSPASDLSLSPGGKELQQRRELLVVDWQASCLPFPWDCSVR